MNVLILGGTRYFGIHAVHALINAGYNVTVATRGLTADQFKDKVNRIKVNRTDPLSLSHAFKGKSYDNRKALGIGYRFADLEDVIYKIIDGYIK